MLFFSLYNPIQSLGIWYQLETATVTSSVQTQAAAEEMCSPTEYLLLASFVVPFYAK